MTQDEVLDEFRAAGALLTGHFILTSGRRSPVFLQKMFVFQDPARTERLCKALAVKLKEAFGGVYIANEGFDFDSAQQALASGWADAVAFGKLFIAK